MKKLFRGERPLWFTFWICYLIPCVICERLIDFFAFKTQQIAPYLWIIFISVYIIYFFAILRAVLKSAKAYKGNFIWRSLAGGIAVVNFIVFISTFIFTIVTNLNTKERALYEEKTIQRAVEAGQLDLSTIEKAALQDNATAQFILGNSYYYGKGVSRNETIGIYWLKKAAIGGHARARGLLGEFYLRGQNVIRSRKTGCGLLRTSAEQGDRIAVTVYNSECAAGRRRRQSTGPVKIVRYTLRDMYPEYNDMSDYELTRGLHRTKYANVPFEQFAQQFGGPLEEDAFIDNGENNIKQTTKSSVSQTELKQLDAEIKQLVKRLRFIHSR